MRTATCVQRMLRGAKYPCSERHPHRDDPLKTELIQSSCCPARSSCLRTGSSGSPAHVPENWTLISTPTSRMPRAIWWFCRRVVSNRRQNQSKPYGSHLTSGSSPPQWPLPDASMSVKRLETSADAGTDQWRGGFGDRPAFPLPRCFGCWRSLRSCGRRRSVYPQGKGWEIPEGNQRRRSAAGTFSAPQTTTKEGLDRSERTRTIRQDSSKNRKRLLQPERSEARAIGLGAC